VADLPAPAPEESVDNGPKIVPRPANAWPIAPKGFKVELYATWPRQSPPHPHRAQRRSLPGRERDGKIKIFRGVGPTAKRNPQTSVFAEGLHQPFGIAFYPAGANPAWVYIGNTDGIVRFPYKNGDLTARTHPAPGRSARRRTSARRRPLDPRPGLLQGRHKLFASVGSHSNVDDADTHPEEFHRANVLEFTPEGKFIKIYARGLRNCVGEAINPTTGELWCSTNERDGLGNNLVPDYVTHVQEGGFYGWPWFYYGGPGGGFRTRATPASTLSCNPRSSRPTFW
jgi:glucose/arabinose dehydrogenase